MDQNISRCRISIRSAKWWWAFFANLLDIAKHAEYMDDLSAHCSSYIVPFHLSAVCIEYSHFYMVSSIFDASFLATVTNTEHVLILLKLLHNRTNINFTSAYTLTYAWRPQNGDGNKKINIKINEVLFKMSSAYDLILR